MLLPSLSTWCLLAQTFSPELPGTIPPVAGTVTERATLRSIDVKTGEGAAAKPGQEYVVHYTGWLRDGKKFDSSRDRSEPFTFIQGRRSVIAGWEAGFEGMRVGGQRRLFIPYQMAYGEAGRGAIPPKAELIFDVELLAVRDVEPEQPARDLLYTLDHYEKKVLALAEAAPEEKFAFRPSEKARPFGEVLAHLAMANRLIADLSERTPAPAEFRARVEEQWRRERDPRTKAELLALLKQSFADVRARIQPLRAAQWNREIQLFGEKNTVRGAFIWLDAHLAEHVGQLIAYARMQGIKPPWSPE